MTDAERKLWSLLRNSKLENLKFRRQQSVGPYIADFLCAEKMLIIEADGSQHLDSTHDKVRDEFLRSSGYKVLRFWNHDILSNPFGVAERILLVANTPLAPSSGAGNSEQS